MKINNGIDDDRHLCRKLPLEFNLKPYLCFSITSKAFFYQDLLEI